MEQQTITIHFEDKFINLKFTELDTDSDLDDLTKIHYENIIGEIVTISTILNKIGLMKAEVDNRFAESKLDFEIFKSNLRKMIRSRKIADGQKPGKDFSKDDVEDEIICDPVYKDRCLKLLRKEKDCNILNSIYWSVKSKDDKLNNLKNNLTPKEFEDNILEGTINQIMIKIHKKTLDKTKEK
jgi:hypothetical protein